METLIQILAAKRNGINSPRSLELHNHAHARVGFDSCAGNPCNLYTTDENLIFGRAVIAFRVNSFKPVGWSKTPLPDVLLINPELSIRPLVLLELAAEIS